MASGIVYYSWSDGREERRDGLVKEEAMGVVLRGGERRADMDGGGERRE